MMKIPPIRAFVVLAAIGLIIVVGADITEYLKQHYTRMLKN